MFGLPPSDQQHFVSEFAIQFGKHLGHFFHRLESVADGEFKGDWLPLFVNLDVGPVAEVERYGDNTQANRIINDLFAAAGSLAGIELQPVTAFCMASFTNWTDRLSFYCGPNRRDKAFLKVVCGHLFITSSEIAAAGFEPTIFRVWA
jgi:hypothetical protein